MILHSGLLFGSPCIVHSRTHLNMSSKAKPRLMISQAPNVNIAAYEKNIRLCESANKTAEPCAFFKLLLTIIMLNIL